MKILLQFSCCFLALQVVSLVDSSHMEWQEFKTKFGKTYKTPEEEKFRMGVFMNRRIQIAEHNAKYERGEVTYKMGINKFSDMAHDEFANFYTRLKYPAVRPTRTTFNSPDDLSLPDYVNWVKKGAVTPVKNQGQCGSCYAFSATGAMEGQHFLKTGTLVSLSEQNIIDCSHNNGCDGGLMVPAFKYVIKNKGIDTEASYPYEAKAKFCRFNNKTIGATLRSYVELHPGDENALEKAVATVGPISAAVYVDEKFMNYHSGIFSDANCYNKQINHAVLVVGYGTDPRTLKQYWLVKNCWGPEWGEKGYIRIAKRARNMCGIASLASYPVV